MMNLTIVRIAILSVCSMLLLACQLTLLEPENSPNPGAVSQAPGASAAALSELEQALVQRSTDDLAAELGVAADTISLVQIEAVEWPDSSLGCPQPDMMYAQVITSGYQIVLETNGQTYNYHTDSNPDGQVVHCQNDE
ncbi:MAG: hypothetical protein R2911_19845 [Caldilineaceae bacterium]